jgi:hypothetical protein
MGILRKHAALCQQTEMQEANYDAGGWLHCICIAHASPVTRPVFGCMLLKRARNDEESHSRVEDLIGAGGCQFQETELETSARARQLRTAPNEDFQASRLICKQSPRMEVASKAGRKPQLYSSSTILHLNTTAALPHSCQQPLPSPHSPIFVALDQPSLHSRPRLERTQGRSQVS